MNFLGPVLQSMYRSSAAVSVRALTFAWVGLQAFTEAGNFFQLGIGPDWPAAKTLAAPLNAALTPVKYRSSTSFLVTRGRGDTSFFVPPVVSAELP